MIDSPVADDAPLADAPPDAPADAPSFPAACPAAYDITIAAAPSSRYRYITAGHAWLTQHQDCANDLPGATHLVVFDTLAEAQQIAAAATGSSYHAGAAQLPNQAATDAGWFWLTGEPVDAGIWHPGQPNDNAGVENDEQNRGFVNKPDGFGLQDGDNAFQTDAMCECDGKPIDPAVAAIL